MQGKVYKSQSQQLILNVHKFFTLEKLKNGPFIPVTAVYDRTCAALKISGSSLTKIIKRSQQNPGQRPTTPPLNQKKKGRGKVQTLDASLKEAIREILEEYATNKIPVTIEKMHTLLREKELFPYSRASMRLVIQDLGYYFKMKNRKSRLYKRTDMPSEIVWLKEEIDENMETDENVDIDENVDTDETDENIESD